MVTQVKERIKDDLVVQTSREVFHDWNIEKLQDLLNIANSSGRGYGEHHDLKIEFRLLKSRFSQLTVSGEIQKWMKIFSTKELYANISDILHLALCTFVKVPLESTAESIGSVINRHGCNERASLLPASLSTEVQISWNGPSEFSPSATNILEEALQIYFEGKTTGLRFYSNSKVKLVSSSVNSYMKKPSQINF